MKVNTKSFNKALNVVSGGVDRKSTLAVLGNVALVSNEYYLKVMSSRLDLSYEVLIPVIDFINPIKTTIEHKILSKIGSALTGDQVDITSTFEEVGKDKVEKANLACGKYSSKLSTIDFEEFPPLRSFDGLDSIFIDAEKFVKVATKVLPALSTDEARPVLCGMRFFVNNNRLMLEGTDGFRIVHDYIELENTDNSFDIIVPQLTITEVIKTIKSTKCKTLALKKHTHSKTKEYSAYDEIQFSFKNTSSELDVFLTSMLIEGNYPPTEIIMPRTLKIKSSVNVKESIDAVKQLKPILHETTNILRVTKKDGSIIFSCQSEEYGYNQVLVEENSVGEDFAFAVNGSFFMDALTITESDSMPIGFNANNCPLVFSDNNYQEFLSIVMPMHLG